MNDESRLQRSDCQQYHETTFRKKTKLHRQFYNYIRQ